ncbi:hypothetical protein L218DRAFT_688959 [Marasmius fiardii PR-910]|nr:hypothetical protein L218DRAFT_688959 [Marasmius fiardii PR-910]
MSSQRTPVHRQTQPRAYRLTLKGLLSLPFRICNPPPAVGKVRSCSVTPVFNVQLEDILDRKHLPPLGLKDFEEWLLYVEMSPENLYFTLWLKEYTSRYRQWAAHFKSLRRDSARYPPVDWPPQNSSHLAMFYARAKQTFFTPNSNYELNLPSDLLAPFHASNAPLYPDPATFNQVAIETRKMLKESLHRFVSAQFNNVGNKRVVCGLLAGSVCCLIGAVLPIIYNLVGGHSRWLRLTAWPGLWLGITLLLTSLNGVCLGVYIFGDLRQLRKFELTRPPISKPQRFHTPRQRPVISSPITGLPITPIIPLNRPPEFRPSSAHYPVVSHPLNSFSITSFNPITPLPPAYTRTTTTSSRPPSQTSSVESSCVCSLEESDSDQSCYVSPAFYDHDPVDGPATGLFPLPESQPKSGFEHDEDDLFTTATFIHSYVESDDDDDDDHDHEYDPNKTRLESTEERQRIDSFDFDALPPRLPVAELPTIMISPKSTSIQLAPSVMVIQPEAEPIESSFTPMGFIRRMQSRCNINKWLVMTSSHSTTDLGGKEKPETRGMQPPVDESGSEYASNFPRPHPSFQKRSAGNRPRDVDVHKQFKMVKAVPAFASPLTRVYSPVIVRGQWEIVVRSMTIACFITWVILGSLLAVPPPKAR